MTRFGKSRKSSSKRSLHGGITRNPPRDVLTKSLKNLRETKSDVLKHTTKELPYMGSAESAAIADLLNEPGVVDKTALKAKIKDSDECLNSLAFVETVDEYYKDLQKELKAGKKTARSAVFGKFHLDERIPIMVSVGISKVLAGIVDDLKKTAETTISQETGKKGKKIHFITVENLFEYVDKHFSKVINLKSQRITDQNNNISTYQVLQKIDAADLENSLKTPHVSGILTGLLKVDAKHVGETFAYTPTVASVIAKLKDDVPKFINGCQRVEFIVDSSAVDKNRAEVIVGSIFACLATHIMSYAFVASADNLLRSVNEAGYTDAGEIEAQLDNAIFHRAMMYPSLIASLDLYDLSENAFDRAIAKEITTVTAVKTIFKNAIETYDYEASAIAAKTYRHEAPKVPSFLKSPEEVLQAQMKMDKMLIKPAAYNDAVTAGSGGTPAQKALVTSMTYTNPADTDAVAGQKAAEFSNYLTAKHGTWSFGRRRRSSKKRSATASFGKKRRSSKRRVAEFGRKRRSSKKRSEFGRKRRSSKRRHHAVAEFGKRRRRRSVAKFGQGGIEEQLGSGFGRRRRSHKKRASFGRKRRSMKKRAAVASFGRKRRSSKKRHSFGKKRRSSKRRASFGRKRRSSKRRASFGRKRRSSKRRN